MTGWALWLRWSWRDLRRRWLQVAAIALILSIGTGSYAALTSTSTWRERSNDASFAMLAMHDVRVSLIEGVTVPEGTLAGLAAAVPSAGSVTATSERLSVPVQLDASHGRADVLVAGRVVGMPVDTEVDRMHAYVGRELSAADEGRPVGVVEATFADHHDLPATGSVRLGGDVVLDYVGHGTIPEYFAVAGQTGGIGAGDASTFGVLFVSLPTAQRLAGTAGEVSEVVLAVDPDGDRHTVAREIERLLAARGLGAASTVTVRDEEPVYRFLYEDIETDQQFWTIVAGLLLGGAALAAFNLINRVVEAQRREIGVSMALGVRRRHIAVRPLLMGAQIAVAGALLGIAVGVVVGWVVGGVFREFLPLPVWEQPFQYGVYFRAAALGLVVPLVAVAWPVWRAVRVQPVEAIRVGPLATRSRQVPLGRVSVPGRSYHQMPVRSVLRAPRRTTLTALGVGAVIAVLVTVLGLLDAFYGAIDRAEDEVTGDVPQRATVQLTGFVAESGAEVRDVGSSEVVEAATAYLAVPVTVSSDVAGLELVVEMRDLDAGLWRPTVSSGDPDTYPGGLLLAEKAAADLDVRPGDTVQVRHPTWVDGTLGTAAGPMVVAGTHPSPVRATAFLDRAEAERLGLAGIVNAVDVAPASGVDNATLKRFLFPLPGVASVQPAVEGVEAMRGVVGQFTDIIAVAVAMTLALTVLMAFNTTSIAADERVREHATMFAYGLPRRTVVGTSMAENGLIGMLGTGLGLAAGYLILRWVVLVQLPRTLPEFGLPVTLSAQTVAVALATGVVAVTLTPLLNARRLQRMDVPAALRVVE